MNACKSTFSFMLNLIKFSLFNLPEIELYPDSKRDLMAAFMREKHKRKTTRRHIDYHI